MAAPLKVEACEPADIADTCTRKDTEGGVSS